MKTIETLKVTKVSKKDVVTKYGTKPKVGILTIEFGTKWLGHFLKGNYDKAANIKEGDTITAVVEQKGDFVDFSMDKYEILEARVDALENFMKGKVIGEPIKEDGIDAESLPF